MHSDPLFEKALLNSGVSFSNRLELKTILEESTFQSQKFHRVLKAMTAAIDLAPRTIRFKTMDDLLFSKSRFFRTVTWVVFSYLFLCEYLSAYLALLFESRKIVQPCMCEPNRGWLQIVPRDTIV